jgi:hypothetical protein
MDTTRAIPTIGARGLHFRSRLEAQWSFVFTELNWNWEYEPYDLNGYIPDFIVTFEDGNELLVEVKGIMNAWDKEEECEEYILKIKNSGWTKKYMIVGGNVGIGKFSKNGGNGVSLGIVGYIDVDDLGYHNFFYPVLEVHKHDDTWWSIIRIDGDSDDYDIGLNNGQKINRCTKCSDNTEILFQEIWTKSKNATQWNKPNMQTKDVKDTKRKKNTHSEKACLQLQTIGETMYSHSMFERIKALNLKIVEYSPNIQLFHIKKEKRKAVDDSGSA